MNPLRKALKYHIYQFVFCEVHNIAEYHLRMAFMYAKSSEGIEGVIE